MTGSFETIGAPAVIFGLGLTGFMFWWSESVVPASQTKARYIEMIKIKEKSESILTRRKNLLVKGAGNRFFHMQSYLADRKAIVPLVLALGSAHIIPRTGKIRLLLAQLA